MNIQDIKRKAAEASEEYMDGAKIISGPRGSYRKGFIAGAKYMISSLWKSNFDSADKNRPVLVKLKNGLYMLLESIGEAKGIEDRIDGFVYLSDLENRENDKGIDL